MNIRLPLFLVATALLVGGYLMTGSPSPEESQQPVHLAADEGQQAEEVMIDETFKVSDGGVLEVDVSDANVSVETGARSEAQVKVILDARNMDRAREYFEFLRWEVDQDDEVIRISTDPRGTWRWDNWGRTGYINIHVEVYLPADFNADIGTSDGNVTLEEMNGTIQVRTSDGNITTDALTGPEISLRTSDGNVTSATLASESVEVHTSDGNITLRRAEADDLSIRTSDGNITAERLEGEMEVQTSDGNITLGDVYGPRVRIRTSDGNVRTDDVVANYTEVSTSDGDLRLGSVEGDLRATAGGDIRVTLAKPAEVYLSSSDGDITINVPGDFPADVSFRGEDIRMGSGMDFQGRLREESATGSLNGGGPSLEAKASDGTITMREN